MKKAESIFAKPITFKDHLIIELVFYVYTSGKATDMCIEGD